MRHKRILFILALCLVLVVTGCSNNPNAVQGKFGQPLETEFFTFTVVTAALRYTEGEELWDTRLRLTLTVTNHTPVEQPLYYDDFELFIDGETRFPEAEFDEGMLPEAVTLGAGETVVGELLYLLPDSYKNLELVFEEYFDNDVPGLRYAVPVKKRNLS